MLFFHREPMESSEIQNKTVINNQEAKEGRRGLGWALLVVGESDGLWVEVTCSKKVL